MAKTSTMQRNDAPNPGDDMKVLGALNMRAANCYDLFTAILKVVNEPDDRITFGGVEMTLLVQALAEKGVRLAGQAINISGGDFDPANIEGVGHE